MSNPLKAQVSCNALWVGALMSALTGQALGAREATAQVSLLETDPIIAHRGASGLAPESTRAAYAIARELGVRYLEGDVHRTRDGELVVVHDDDVLRTSNFRRVFGPSKSPRIGDLTLEELRQLDMGSWFETLPDGKPNPNWRESYRGLGVLTLAELIELAESTSPGRPSVGLYIETKSPQLYPQIEAQVVALFRQVGWLGPDAEPGRIVFQSFEVESLKRFRELAPEAPRILLIEHWGKQIAKAYHAAAQAPGLAQIIGPIGYAAMPIFNARAHARGTLVQPYVLNKRWQMRLGRMFGADGFFTDRCDTALLATKRTTELGIQAVLSLWDQGSLR